MSAISLKQDGPVSIINMHRPPQNRIDDGMVDEFAVILEAIESSESRAVLVRAEGPDFSFGGDIMKWPDMSIRQLRATFDRYMGVFNRFERLPMPVIAAVQGLCFGGGLELAIRADVIVAGETSRFGHPEQSLGIVTLLGGVYRVAERAGRSFASEWSMSSQQVPAATMLQHGVINRIVPDASLGEESLEMAKKAASGPTLAYAVHKVLLRIWAESGVAAADSAMLDVAMPLFNSDDVRRGIPSAVNALKAGKPRPALDFQGR